MEIIINFLYSLTNDLGITIILLTIGVKLLLLPISFKSRKSATKQTEISKQMEEVKIKYSKNKRKREMELEKLQGESMKNTGGCLLMFLQLPVISLLYTSINSITLDGSSILTPWVYSLKMADPLYIVPILYLIISLVPLFIKHLRDKNFKIFSVINMIPIIMTMFLVTSTPLILGLYFLTSRIFSFIEEEGYILFSNKFNTINT